MTQGLAEESSIIALELHRLLREFDPARFRAELAVSARRRIAALRSRLEESRGRLEELRARSLDGADRGVGSPISPEDGGGSGGGNVAVPVAASLGRLAALVQHPVSALEGEHAADESRWVGYHKQLGEAYEALSHALRAHSVRLPGLRPTNYTRSAVHVASGVAGLVLIEHFLSDVARAAVPFAFALTFWFLEVLRRRSERANRFLMWVFHKIAHPREAHHVNSSTWYATSLALLGLFFPKACSSLALVVLAFGDPAASFVGRRWGRLKLYNGRTLEGTLSFALVAALAGFVALYAWHGAEYGALRALVAASVAAAVAALTELFCKKVDDNFAVPLAAAGAAWATLALF